MADRTSISWTDATWNPISGCSRVSEGCRNCYAEGMAARFNKPGQWGEGLATMVRTPEGKAAPRWTGEIRLNEGALYQPLRWRKPRRIFVNSTSDLFHEAVPDEWIDKVFAVMALSPQHTFQILTKRPERMLDYMHFSRRRAEGIARHFIGLARSAVPEVVRWPLPNVWLGVSVEDDVTAHVRLPYLVATPATVRFASVEPLLGPVDLNPWLFIITHDDEAILAAAGEGEVPALEWREPATIRPEEISQPRIDWVIVGGESGPRARPMHPDWVRKIRDQCNDAAVPFHFKQWGEWAPVSGCDVYCHGPHKRERAYPNSAGICWLADGRILYRDFSAKEHARRIAAGEAYNTRSVEVDYAAIGDFDASVRDEGRPVANPLGLQWMYQVGKGRAGRHLDGVEHLAFPQVTP